MSIYKNYYVYLYLREKDGTPYYVGKGKNNRFKDKHRVNIPTKEENIIFVKEDLSNEEACKLEIELIAFYGRKDLGEGILHNQTDGGDGGDTSKSENYQKWLHEVARNKDSDYNKTISKRMKEDNPLFDSEVAKKCQTPEARKKRGLSRRGEIRSKEQREKISNTLKKQSAELSNKSKKNWCNPDYVEKVNAGMMEAASRVFEFTEEEFYEWIKDKKLLTYDPKRKIYRPNARVKRVVEFYGKIEEFYGDFFREREKNRKNRDIAIETAQKNSF